MRHFATLTHAIAAICAVACPLAAWAQAGGPAADQRYWFQATGIVARLDSTSQSSSTFTNAQGSYLALESDYGLPSRKAVPSLSLGMRLSQRWRIEGGGLWIDRSGSAVTLGRPLVFDDYTYPTNTTVRAGFNYQGLRFHGGFSFIQSETNEIGVSLGLLSSSVRTSVELAGTSTGNAGTLPRVTRNANSVIPMLGMFGHTAISPEWGVSWRLEAGRDFGSGSRDSNASNLAVNAIWRATPQVAVHFGFTHFESRTESTPFFLAIGASLFSTTKTKITISGPQVGLSFGF